MRQEPRTTKLPATAEDCNRKKNRRFVVVTFCASLALFFAAGAYDYIRPLVRPHIVSILEYFLALIEPWIALPQGTCTVAIVDLRSPAEKTAVLGVISELFFLPALLSVLPLTHWWKRVFIEAKGSKAAGVSLDETAAKEGIRVCSLLFIIAWMLWIVAAAALFLGILLGPSVVGIISVAALLSFFAQVVGGVGCLLLTSDEDDDIRRETQSIGESINASVSATAWANKSSLQAGGKSRNELNEGSDGGKEASVRDTGTRVMSSPLRWITKGKNREFLLFFFMKIMLLQTPYAMQLGLHLLHTCVSCVGLNYRWTDSSSEQIGSILPKEIPSAVAFLCTLLVPLFTHGVGGILFNGSRWKFHHPWTGGTSHVTAQATGWSLVGVAGVLHLAFFILGTGHQHAYLLHSGSILSIVAEGLLLYSLTNFLPGKEKIEFQTKRASREVLNASKFIWIVLSYIQDIAVTNLHWFCPLWFMCTLLGFDMFHPFRSTSTSSAILANSAVAAFLCSLPTILIEYTPRRKQWKWNVFGRINDAFVWFLFHPSGLFSGSELKVEESLDEYTKGGAMFAMAPHGTLPTSVVAVWHQFEEVFSDVCAFFGSQVSLVPNYRFFLGMRGGFLPVEKKRLVQVMSTRQSVGLVPGGVSEMLSCDPHGKTINVSIKHKGFVRLAMQHGYDLIPTFFFHANDQYNNPARVLQLWTYKLTGVPMGVPLYTNRWGMPLSNGTPVRVALGKRIPVKRNPSPTAQEIDSVHRLFYEEVVRVWDKYKDEFGYGDRELAYVT